MLAPFALTLALLAPSAPIPKDMAPAGPPPYLLDLKSEADGKVRFTVVRTEKVKVTVMTLQLAPNGQQVAVPVEREQTVTKHVRIELAELKDLKVYTPEGKEVDAKEAAKKLGESGMAIASVNGQKVDSAFLKMFKDDVLILVSPDLVPSGPGVRRPVGFPTDPLTLPPPGGIRILPAPAIEPLPPLIPPEAPPVPDKPAVKKD